MQTWHSSEEVVINQGITSGVLGRPINLNRINESKFWRKKSRRSCGQERKHYQGQYETDQDNVAVIHVSGTVFDIQRYSNCENHGPIAKCIHPVSKYDGRVEVLQSPFLPLLLPEKSHRRFPRNHTGGVFKGHRFNIWNTIFADKLIDDIGANK